MTNWRFYGDNKNSSNNSTNWGSSTNNSTNRGSSINNSTNRGSLILVILVIVFFIKSDILKPKKINNIPERSTFSPDFKFNNINTASDFKLRKIQLQFPDFKLNTINTTPDFKLNTINTTPDFKLNTINSLDFKFNPNE